MKVFVCAALCLTLVLAPIHNASAWGQKGHRIVGAIAANHLNETTKRAIQQLLQNKSLASIAVWADTIKKDRPETKPWHYVDIPNSDDSYSEGRDCLEEHQELDCVVAKIDEFSSVLTDRNATLADRQEALKFLVHLVGDINQPLHAAKDARGGNGIDVTFFGESRCGRFDCNLHGVWDDSMIEHTGMTQAEYVQHLEKLIKEDGLTADGKTVDWANESHKLAQAAWVTSGTDITQEYYDTQIKVVDHQLAIAGLRLAKLLNDTLGTTSPGSFRRRGERQSNVMPDRVRGRSMAHTS